MTPRVSKHSNQPRSVIFMNFYNFLNNDVIMSSLVSTENCKLCHDCRRVCSHRRHDETVANQLRIRVHTADADATKQFRPVGVGCVYWALEPLEPFGLISDYCSGLVVQQLGVVKYTLDGVCLYNHRCMFQTGTLSSFAPKFELNFAVDHV